MAYSIGPRFNSSLINSEAISNRYLDEVKMAREAADKNFERLMTGIKGIGTGIGKARQWSEAEAIKAKQGDLTNLKNELAALKAERDRLISDQNTASGRQYGIDQQILAQRNLPTDADIAGMAQAYGSIDRDYQNPTEDTYSVPMQYYYRPGRRSGI